MAKKAKPTKSKGKAPAKGPAKKPAKRGAKDEVALRVSADGEPKLDLFGSRMFSLWLAENRVSLAFTTYQTGKLFFVGLQQDGRLSVFERTFNRCMGLCAHEGTLHMSSLYQMWRFENVLEPGQASDGYDQLYVPMAGHTTGDIDIHDIAVDKNGRVIFVNTLFSCLATIGDKDSFVPLWQPRFISRLAAEDRCHLNGLATFDGVPRYVTAVGDTDVADGWRSKRRDGGCVVDVKSGEVVAHGLSMPHSPRIYKDRLWLLNSGTGEFGTLSVQSGKFEPVAFCPGYLRGMSFVGDYAIIGLSKPRDNATFTGLPLEETLAAKNAEAQCGIQVIDLNTGDAVHWLRMEGIVEELYDVVALPGARRPMALGFKTDEIRRVLSIGEPDAL